MFFLYWGQKSCNLLCFDGFRICLSQTEQTHAKNVFKKQAYETWCKCHRDMMQSYKK